MLNCLCRKTTMSVDQFLSLQRGNITLREIRKENKAETFMTKVIENDRFNKFAITALGLTLYAKDALGATKGLDPLGWKLLGLIRHWAKWILLIMCLVEIIRAGLGGDSKKIFPIIMKFLTIYAAMYLIPELFDAIESAF
jgi:hypothetical protein